MTFARMLATAFLASGAAISPANAQGYNWTGIYAGAHFGALSVSGANLSDVGIPSGAGGTPSFTAAQVRALTAGSSEDTERMGGGQIGFNWQFNQAFVVGIETDISAVSSSSDSFTTSAFDAGNGVFANVTFADKTSIDYLGTLRGRLGVLVSEPLLLFVTGGLAYAQTESTATFSATYPGSVVRPDAGALGDKDTQTGYTIGGGIEYAAGANLSVKFEGLYYDLGTSTSSFRFSSFNTGNALISTHTVTRRQDLDGTIFRMGINYGF